MGFSCFTFGVPLSNLHSSEFCLDEACSLRNSDNIFMLEYNKNIVKKQYDTNALCVSANANNSFPVTHTHTH